LGHRTPEECVVSASNRSPAEKRLAAQQATKVGWARTRNRTARTQPGRDAWRAKLADQIDPNHEMSKADRQDAAEQLVGAHMLKMSRLAAEARRRKKNGAGVP
jgi:hypothetical protein